MIRLGELGLVLLGCICGSFTTVFLVALAVAIKDNKRRNKNESVDR